MHRVRYEGAGEAISIQSLDSLISKLGIPRINLMIIDIEGFEYLALKGLEVSLCCGIIDHLVCEVHPAMLKEIGYCADDILNLLSRYGYRAIHNTKTTDLRPYHIFVQNIEQGIRTGDRILLAEAHKQ